MSTGRMPLESATLDRTFRALADPTRRAIVRDLSQGERGIVELAAPFDISLSAVSKHIRVLETAGLVHREIRGRDHRCRLSPRPMAAAMQWLLYYQQFWSDSLDAMDELLHQESTESRREGERDDPR